MQVRTKVVYEHDVYTTLPYQEQITDLLLCLKSLIFMFKFVTMCNVRINLKYIKLHGVRSVHTTTAQGYHLEVMASLSQALDSVGTHT